MPRNTVDSCDNDLYRHIVAARFIQYRAFDNWKNLAAGAELFFNRSRFDFCATFYYFPDFFISGNMSCSTSDLRFYFVLKSLEICSSTRCSFADHLVHQTGN
jgi:hypothetical protein